LLQHIAFIWLLSDDSAYGVYVPAIDHEIKRERVKAILSSQGFTVEDAKSDYASEWQQGIVASHPEKNDEEIKQSVNEAYRQADVMPGSNFGINVGKTIQEADQQASKIISQEEQAELPYLDEQRKQEIRNGILTIHLAATIVHEAVHAQGSMGEGPSEAAEADISTDLLQAFNEQQKTKAVEKTKQKFQADPTFSPDQMSQIEEWVRETYPDLHMDKAASSWYESAIRKHDIRKESQSGAQFTVTSDPSPDVGPAAWSGVFWGSGFGPIESMLQRQRVTDRFQFDNIVERQMREMEKAKWSLEVDTTEHTEDLLDKDRQPLKGYRTTEELMEERRTKPLMVPVPKESSAKGVTKVAYAGESGSAFGWFQNLNLPMGERVIPWAAAKYMTMMNWVEQHSGESTVRDLPRYNPEYDRKGFYMRWKEPRFSLELWDRMIGERPLFMTSPARRFAKKNDNDDTLMMGLILESAVEAINSGRIMATRFVATPDIAPHIMRFFQPDEDISTATFDQCGDMIPIWVSLSSIPEEKLTRAEEYASGRSSSWEDEALHDKICGIAEARHAAITTIIATVKNACKNYGVNDVYVVGGFPRALAMNESWANIKDLDFSSAWADQCLKVGGLVAEELGAINMEIFHRTMTLSWEWMGMKCDFRGMIATVDVREQMREKNISTTPLHMDVYSRDFTVNMLIYSMKEGKIYDVSKTAKKDLDAKLLRTYFDADGSVQRNPIIILRAIKYLVRYDFNLDPSLSEAMKKHADLVFDGRYSDERLAFARSELLAEGKEKATALMEQYGLERLIEMEKED